MSRQPARLGRSSREAPAAPSFKGQGTRAKGTAAAVSSSLSSTRPKPATASYSSSSSTRLKSATVSSSSSFSRPKSAAVSSSSVLARSKPASSSSTRLKAAAVSSSMSARSTASSTRPKAVPSTNRSKAALVQKSRGGSTSASTLASKEKKQAAEITTERAAAPSTSTPISQALQPVTRRCFHVEFKVRCNNLPCKDGAKPDPVVGLYTIDFAKAVALFLSNTEPVMADPSPKFATPLVLDEYKSGSSKVVAFYVYNTHATPGQRSLSAGDGMMAAGNGMMEASPEDCVGYCVLSLDDVYKSVFVGAEVASTTLEVELGYALHHPDPQADAVLQSTTSKLYVSILFRHLRDEIEQVKAVPQPKPKPKPASAGTPLKSLSKAACTLYKSFEPGQAIPDDALLLRGGGRLSFGPPRA